MLHSTSGQYANPIAETLAPLFEKLLTDSSPFTHVVAATSSNAKSVLPRVSALLNVPTVSDVTSLTHDAAAGSTTFTRPIYAGNAIATVRAPADIAINSSPSAAPHSRLPLLRTALPQTRPLSLSRWPILPPCTSRPPSPSQTVPTSAWRRA